MRLIPEGSASTVVLKFGGSVLLDELRMRAAVHEVYRWRRKGHGVVAVVSALAGRTDALLAKCERLYQRRAPTTEAAIAATGELESAALLGLHLDRAGIPAVMLSPSAISFRATGHPLDADPVSVDTRVLRAALDEHGVAVVPGYVATRADGATVVLGRGGSDLTALFLARAIGAARCRLIKDVDGLYERDPAGDATARRHATATYADALGTDGTIVQHKAVRLARDLRLGFELGAFNGVAPTQVGARRTTFGPRPAHGAPLRVALLGHGTVGRGVRELLENLPGQFIVASVCVRDPSAHANLLERGIEVACDPLRAADADADVVVELMGGTDAAACATGRALTRGKHVVTANKAVLAEHGDGLRALAEAHGVALLGSAAVGGAAPIREALRTRDVPVRSIQAVLNGTVSYMLGALGRGVGFDQALAEAKRLGFAEADPARDLDGRDAADKLRVLARDAGFALDAIERDALGPATTATANHRQIATLDRRGGAVRLVPVAGDHAFATLREEENAAQIEWADGASTFVRGAGAGRWPTAEAVMADLLALERRRHQASAMYTRRRSTNATAGPAITMVQGTRARRARRPAVP